MNVKTPRLSPFKHLPSLHPFWGCSVFIGELFTIRGARASSKGGTEMTTKIPDELVSGARQTIEVDFLYLDLTTCSRCRGSDASLRAAVETVRPVLDAGGAAADVSMDPNGCLNVLINYRET